MKLTYPLLLLIPPVLGFSNGWAQQSSPRTVTDPCQSTAQMLNSMNLSEAQGAVRDCNEDEAIPSPTAQTTPPTRSERVMKRSPEPFVPSEFESFVADEAGHPLPVFGRSLFEETPSTFAPMDRVPVPATYVLGPGDELMIRVWGKVEIQARVTVDRNGGVFLPRIGMLNVTGLRYEQLDGYLRSAIENLYKGFDLSVTMGHLRSIQIFVLGSARQPGSYTVSGLSTLVDALFASGGPSSTGTMRRIQLMRAHRVYAELDAYEMLRRGDTSHDAQLMPGDVIYIPAIGPQVAIIGSVKEPGIYELKGDMTISSALDDVGGLTSLASTERALLERVDSGRLRRVDEFALDQMGRQRVLADGDVLRVFSISPKFENAVTVQGNVSHPGRFRWHEGMRISELFPTRESLLTREYWNQQNSLAANSSPMSLTAAQMATGMQTVAGVQALQLQANAGNPVLGQRAHWDQPISPSSAVRPDMLTGIIQSGARINWDYAVIERRDDRDLSTRLISFNLGNAIDNPASLDDQVVHAGDVIKVLSHNDVQVSQDKAPTLVRIAGEVNAPGIYRANPGETLRDLVIRAGGLTSRSYLYASQLTRISTRQSQEDQLRVASAEMQRELTAQFSSSRPLNTTGTAESQTQFSSQQALIAQLSSLKPTGRIVLDLKPDASGVNSIPAYPVEDGDSFYIPATVGTIQVAGSVYNPNAFRFQQGRQLSSYLNDAGGPTRQADEKRVFLIRADGRVVSKHGHNGLWGSKFESLTLLPGDAIIVPTKTKLNPMGSFAQQLPYLAQIISQTAMTGAAIGMAY